MEEKQKEFLLYRYHAIDDPKYQHDRDRILKGAAEDFIKAGSIDDLFDERRDVARRVLDFARKRIAEGRDRAMIHIGWGPRDPKYYDYDVRMDYWRAEKLFEILCDSEMLEKVRQEYAEYAERRRLGDKQ